MFKQIAIVILISLQSLASPLEPVKTETPRDSMKSFMHFMNKYKQANDSGSDNKEAFLSSAGRILDVSEFSVLTRQERAEEAAILLKEVIDRVILIDLEKVPDVDTLNRWRLRDTEITLVKKLEGERTGEYLFSTSTVNRAKEFYEKVKHLNYLKGSGEGASYKENIFENALPSWLNKKWVVYSNWQWLGVLLLLFLGLVIEKLGEYILRPVQKLTDKSKVEWDDKVFDAIKAPFGWVLTSLFWLFTLPLLAFEGLAKSFFSISVKLFLSASLIFAAYKLVDILTDYLQQKSLSTEFPLDDQLVPLIHRALKIFTLLFGVLIAMQNFGVNVMSLLAGLGLGGLAFALAAKDALSNLFGSIMILSDKPFKIGDWITVGGLDGNVESIGFRSTRLRTFYNSQVSVPNSILANANIDNMGRRTYRRVKAVLGLTYSTSAEQIEAFLEGVKNILKANAYVVQDNFYVAFTDYGASSLDILVYFHFDIDDRSIELEQRQQINLSILRLAEQLGVEFAFPSQSIYVESTPDKSKTIEIKSLQDLKKVSKSFGRGEENFRPEGMGIYTPRHKDV